MHEQHEQQVQVDSRLPTETYRVTSRERVRPLEDLDRREDGAAASVGVIGFTRHGSRKPSMLGRPITLDLLCMGGRVGFSRANIIEVESRRRRKRSP
jgi:hypothetical protein